MMRVALVALGQLAVWALRFAASYLEEEDIRRRQRRLREAKSRLHAARDEVRRLAWSRQLERQRREYLRRGALIAYRKAQLELIDESLDALNEAKSRVYATTRRLRERLAQKDGRGYISEANWSAFHALVDQLHGAIADSKALTDELHRRKDACRRELGELTDGTTHARLGAKKKVQALLEETRELTLKRFRTPELKDATLTVHHAVFALDARCTRCRIYVSGAMRFCFMCGEERGGEDDLQPIRFFKKDVVGELSCPECHAPTEEGFEHCYNCGEEQDPFGMKEVA